MSNIKEVAKRAGVSVAAVSRALNNYPDIKATTKAHILKVAEELHYYPSASARHLVTNRTNTIGVLYQSKSGPGLRQPFMTTLLESFKNEIGSQGYDLLMFSNTKAPFDKMNILDRVRHRDVDGLLMLESLGDQLVGLVDAGIPMVGVDYILKGKRIGSVTSENRRSIHELIVRLYRSGYRKFGFVHSQMDLNVSVERLQGFYSGLSEVGVTPNMQWVLPGRFELESGARAANQYLQLDEKPEVIICAADIIAMGLMNVFRQQGVRIPDDISVVGFDDIDPAAYVYPPLTTIRQDTLEMGKIAARSLVRFIEDENFVTPQHYVTSTSLVVRESTRPLVD
jgi:LacI family transcriptional regulator